MIPPLAAALPSLSFEILLGWVKLRKRSQFACLDDIDPSSQIRVEHGLRGNIALYGYADYSDKGSGPRGSMLADTMQSAVQRVAEHIVQRGGYDILIGFAQGADILANLVRILPALRARLPRRTVHAIALFGCRFHQCYSPRFGGLPAVTFSAGSLKVFVSSGMGDTFDKLKPDAENTFDMNAIGSALRQTGADVVVEAHRGAHHIPRQGDPALDTLAIFFSPIPCVAPLMPFLMCIRRCASDPEVGALVAKKCYDMSAAHPADSSGASVSVTEVSSPKLMRNSPVPFKRSNTPTGTYIFTPADGTCRLRESSSTDVCSETGTMHEPTPGPSRDGSRGSLHDVNAKPLLTAEASKTDDTKAALW